MADCLIGGAGCLSSGAPVAIAGAVTAAMDNCDDVAGTVLGGLPTGYVITSNAYDASVVAIPVGDPLTCTVTGPNGDTSTFNALAAP